MPWHLKISFFCVNDMTILDRFECDIPWAAVCKETVG